MKYLKVFTDFLDVTEPLTDGAMGRLFRAMLRYARDGAEPALKGKEGVAWAVARQSIDREKDAYAAMVEARRDAGRSGAKARWQKLADHGKHGQDKDNDNDKYKDKDKDSLSSGSGPDGPVEREKKPSLEEVMAFSQALGLQADVPYFYNYYEANGWHIGNQSIRDWKAALIAWARKTPPRGSAPRQTNTLDEFRAAMEMARREEAKRI